MSRPCQHHCRRYDRCSGFRPGQCGGWVQPEDYKSGAANMAIRAKGLQIGLFNYYKEKLDGFQLGDWQRQSPNKSSTDVFFGGNASELNVQVPRFETGLLYSSSVAVPIIWILAISFPLPSSTDAGLELPLYRTAVHRRRSGIPTYRNLQGTRTTAFRHVSMPSRHVSIWNTT